MRAMTRHIQTASGVVSLLAAVVVMALLPGCGETSCAEGTVRQDGECVIAAESCGPRTVLMDGVCVLEEEACENSQLEDGVCVPDGSACSGETTFDVAVGRCVPDGSAACGVGTTLDANGRCIATEDACEFPTLFQDGYCVVGPRACDRGAVLDPATNKCVFEAPNCSDGTVYSELEGHCRTTSEVCGPGTEFDTEYELCLPDACEVGDVLVHGLCFPEDVVDPLQGGLTHNEEGSVGESAAHHVRLPPAGDNYELIGRFHSVDANGNPRNTVRDRDYYVFDGEALDRITIGLFSFGYGPAYFEVTGPTGRTWRGTPHTLNQAARELILPVDGEYTIELGYGLPDDHPYYGGDPDWLYSLVLGQKQFLAPSKDIDVTSPTTVRGALSTIDANFYRIKGYNRDRPLEIRFLPGALPESARIRFFPEGRVGPEYDPTYETLSYTPVGRHLYMLVDWGELEEIPDEYAFEISSVEQLLGANMGAGGASSRLERAERFDRIRVEKVSTSGTDRVFVEILAPSGEKVSKTRLDEMPDHSIRALETGIYTIRLQNKDTQPQSAEIRVSRTQPALVGALTDQWSVAMVYPSSDAVGGAIVDVGNDDWLQLRGRCASTRDPVPFQLLRTDGTVLKRATSELPCTSDWRDSVRVPVEPNQTYLVRFPTLGHNVEFAARAVRPPRWAMDLPPWSESRQISTNCAGGDISSYEFYVRYSAPLEFELSAASGQPSLTYELISHETGVIAGERVGAALETGLLPAGKYLLTVGCNQQASSASYTLEGRATEWSNQSLGAASVGTTTFGVSLPASPSVHYRGFTTPPDSLLRFSVTNATTGANQVEMGLHAGDARLLQPTSALEDASTVTRPRQQIGFGLDTFIAAFEETSKDFDFVVEVDPATDAGLLDERQVVITLTDVQDVQSKLVKFELAEASLVYLTAIGAALPADQVRLYDDSGDLLHEATMDGASVVSGAQTLSAGTYYLEVETWNAGAGTYDLALRSIPASQVFSRDQLVTSRSTGLTQDLQIAGCGVASEVHVFVELDTHVASNDVFDGGSVELEIVHPRGRSVILSEANGRSWDPRTALFGVDATAVTLLDAFDQVDADGTWALRIRDTQHDHTHDLVRWGLWLDCA